MESEALSEEVMSKYVKYRKSLDSKSKAKKEKKICSSDQASLSSSRAGVLNLFRIKYPLSYKIIYPNPQ